MIWSKKLVKGKGRLGLEGLPEVGDGGRCVPGLWTVSGVRAAFADVAFGSFAIQQRNRRFCELETVGFEALIVVCD